MRWWEIILMIAACVTGLLLYTAYYNRNKKDPY